jgi:hypothetical protein
MPRAIASLAMPDHPIQLSNSHASSPACRGARAAPWSVPSRKSEGDGALDGAGAVDGRARGPPRGRADLRKIRPEITGHTGPAAPSGAPSRRFPCCAGPRFRAAAQTCPPVVSQLLAGDRCVPGRSPDAARVRAVRQHARGRRTGEGPELPGARHQRSCAESPAPPLVRPAITTPHESAPQRTR